MSDDKRIEITISSPDNDGRTVHAWCGPWKGEEEEVFHVQWRNASGKPEHQPFRVRLWEAPGILEQLAAFARHANDVSQ